MCILRTSGIVCEIFDKVCPSRRAQAVNASPYGSKFHEIK